MLDEGPPPGKKRQALDLQAVRERMQQGESMRKIAVTLGVSPALLSKRLREKSKRHKTTAIFATICKRNKLRLSTALPKDKLVDVAP